LIKTGFIGQYEHSLDEKGRVSIPSKYKKYIEETTSNPDNRSTVVLSKGKDRCIEVFTADKWEKMVEEYTQGTKLNDESEDRTYIRKKLANSSDVVIDKSGRIIIPQFLKEYAGIGKNVIFVGVADRFEIWETSAFAAANK
jgi:MraZ protein